MAGAGLATGMFNLVGNSIGALFQHELDEQTREADREFQRQMQREVFHYNSAPEQRKRLEEAGINPALAFSQGSLGTAVGGVPSSISQPKADFSGIASGLGSTIANVELQSRAIQSDNELKDSQSAINRITAQNKLASDIADLQYKRNLAAKEGKTTEFMDEQLAQLKDMYYLTQKGVAQDILLKRQQINESVSREYLNRVTSNLQRMHIKLVPWQIKQIQQEINESVARVGYLDAEKLGQILDNGKVLPDVYMNLQKYEHLKDNPTESQILNELGLWVDPVTDMLNTGANVRRSKPRSQVKRERTYDSNGNSVTREYQY